MTDIVISVPHLRHYLLDRDIVVSNALKKDLVACCRAACILNLQPPKQYTTDYRNRGPEEVQTNLILIPSETAGKTSCYPQLLQSAIEVSLIVRYCLQVGRGSVAPRITLDNIIN